MKTLHYLSLTVIMCCLLGGAKAQYVAIPDTTFAFYLQQYYPNCMNGTQMDTTCADIINAGNLSITGPLQFYSITDLTGIQYFDALNSLVVNVHTLSYIPAFPTALTKINLDDNMLTGLPDLPVNLDTLAVRNNMLTSLPPLPSALKLLDCYHNPALTGWPALPPALLVFNCAYDSLTALPALPASVTHLDCSDNLLDSLPALPAGLQYLSCAGNNFTSLPALNPTLRELDCGYRLAVLPVALPDSLITLTCSGGTFTALPVLPLSLINLNLYNVHITTLPVLPPQLASLSVMNTLVSSLPPLPQSLRSFSFSANQLTTLPALPDSLEGLYCAYSQLSSLPSLPATLKSLECDHNQLSSLPELPDTMYRLDCTYNPDLHCLPLLKVINELHFDPSAITCLPNRGHIGFLSSPAISQMPICDPFNENGCQVFSSVSGYVYHDTNSDCLQNNDEGGMYNLKVNLLQNGTVVQQTYTVGYGSYSFETTPGDYTITIDTTDIPFTIYCPASGVDSASITVTDSVAYARNFAMQCAPGFDLDIHAGIFPVLGFVTPGDFITLNVLAVDMATLWNQSCNTSNLSGQLVLTYNGPATYISAAPNALTPVVSGNTLTYTINDWSTVINGDFDFIVQVDTMAQAGQQICLDVAATPTVGDRNPANNQLTQCITISNSFDPNEKEVYPAGNLDINGDHWLTYTVRFQNTGNAPARHIYITDTIDTDVNIETFQLLAYSFQPQVVIKGNAVRFNFANINLPDSLSDEPNSHGYVQYKVKVKDNATVGTVINNTAFIYFDFNAPVVTSTTTNTLTLFEGINTPLATATMQLYPNPANDAVMINLSDNLSGGTLTLSDVTGRSLNSISITSTHNQLNTSALSSGVYLITAVKGGTRVVQRLVIGK